MKQGRADHSNSESVKREPISHAVDPCAVADMGIETGYNSKPLYDGRGYEAPMAGKTVHPKGSQS